MADNFLKANNHQQGKIFFNSYKSSPYFISRQNSSCPAHPPWRSTASGKWEKSIYPAACLQGIMPGH